MGKEDCGYGILEAEMMLKVKISIFYAIIYLLNLTVDMIQ